MSQIPSPFPNRTPLSRMSAVGHRLAISLLAVAGLAVARVTAADLAPFPDGTRWLAIGDSITQNGAYVDAVNLFYHTRYPERRIEALNAGVSGDTAGGALRRYDWDIAAQRPTVATVMFGMNDVGREYYQVEKPPVAPENKRAKALDDYRASTQKLVERLKKNGVQVILLTPSPFDQTGQQARDRMTGVNDALGICGTSLTEIAGSAKLGLIDLHGPMTALNARLQATDPAATLIGGDRVHPGAIGNMVMAYHILKAQGVRGTVAKTTIDAAKGTIQVHDNVTISSFAREGRGFRFTYAAQALPFPCPPDSRKALSYVPLVQELNQELLVVTGLSAGTWEVIIDNDSVAKVDAAELTAGLNLATLPTTPQLEQARQVATILSQRSKIVGRLRNIALVEYQMQGTTPPVTWEVMEPLVTAKLAKLKPNEWYAGILKGYIVDKPHEDELRRQLPLLDEEIYKAGKPLSHVIRLRPIAATSDGKSTL